MKNVKKNTLEKIKVGRMFALSVERGKEAVIYCDQLPQEFITTVRNQKHDLISWNVYVYIEKP